MGTADTRILEKIKKCLALAADGRGDPTTAATALRQAQALMREHNISLGTVHAAAVGEGRSKLGAWTRPAAWELQLAALLCRAFGCQYHIALGNPERKQLASAVFLGLHGQVESCVYAFEVIRRSAVQARTEYVRTKVPEHLGRGKKMAEGDTFVRGYLTNVDKQISELVLEPAQKAAVDAKRLEALGEKPKNYGPAPKQGSADAFYKGVDEGSKLSVHRAAGSAPAPSAPRLQAPPARLSDAAYDPFRKL